MINIFENCPSIVPSHLGSMYPFGWSIPGVCAGPSVEAHHHQKRIQERRYRLRPHTSAGVRAVQILFLPRL